MARALVLAGGTALGADQVYPLEQLSALHGVTSYGHVAGVSVGSVNGSMFASDQLPQLRTIWESIDGTGSFMKPRLINNLFPGWLCPPGIMTLRPLRKKLEANISISQLLPSVEFTVGVTDFQEDRYHDLSAKVFSGDEDFIDSIIASSAQPVLMQTHRVYVQSEGEKRWCYDGGVKHVVPMIPDPSSWDHIDVVLCNPPLRLKAVPRSKMNDIVEVGLRAFNIMTNENVLISDVERLLDWEEQGASITIYAPEELDDEFDASATTIEKRLNEIGKWMWEHPWTVSDFLDHWKNS